jgi:hypothetical protein
MRSLAVRFRLACAAAMALGACASTSRPTDAWVGGDPTHLAADTAACHQESAGIDPNAISGYSDPRYGMTSAMAAAVAKDNPLADTSPQAHAAAFAACMNDKGWRQP